MRSPVVVLLSILLSGRSSPDGGRDADVRLLDAVMKGDQRAVRELLRNRADVNTAQPDGSTVLMLAVERNHRGNRRPSDTSAGERQRGERIWCDRRSLSPARTDMSR